jgi:pimeloyl-ACP methyl ester carboxylesterase
MDMPTFVIWILGLAAGALALFGGAAWGFARLWARPSRVFARRTPDDVGLDAESVTFKSGSKPLHAWFVPTSGRDKPSPTAILVHGWSSESSQMLPVASVLSQAGYSVLAYDARGHGSSPGDGPITLRKFTDDIIAGLDYVASRDDVDPVRVALVGHSFGAASALLAAAEDPRISAVVSLSGFSDPVEVTRRALKALHLPRGLFLKLVLKILMRWMDCRPEAITPGVQIGRISVPILLAHGSRDRRIPASELDRLASAANPALVTRLLVDGSGHRSLLKSAELARMLPEFLKNAFEARIKQSRRLTKVA